MIKNSIIKNKKPFTESQIEELKKCLALATALENFSELCKIFPNLSADDMRDEKKRNRMRVIIERRLLEKYSYKITLS